MLAVVTFPYAGRQAVTVTSSGLGSAETAGAGKGTVWKRRRGLRPPPHLAPPARAETQPLTAGE